MYLDKADGYTTSCSVISYGMEETYHEIHTDRWLDALLGDVVCPVSTIVDWNMYGQLNLISCHTLHYSCHVLFGQTFDLEGHDNGI